MNCIKSNCYDYLLKPSIEGFTFLKKGLTYSYPLKKRAIVLIKGAFLITPVLGTIIQIFRKVYGCYQRKLLPLNFLSNKNFTEFPKDTWLDALEVQSFFEMLGTYYPGLFIPEFSRQVVTPAKKAKFKETLLQGISGKAEQMAFFAHIGHIHWGLIFVDTTKKTIEYYDSKEKFGNFAEYQAMLQEIASELDFTYVAKINKCLQTDSYQCGPWTCYFLEKRLNCPDFDFNSLDVDACQNMIGQYRQNMFATLHAFHGVVNKAQALQLKNFQKKYGDKQADEAMLSAKTTYTQRKGIFGNTRYLSHLSRKKILQA